MADVYLACTQGPGGFQKLFVVKLRSLHRRSDVLDDVFSTRRGSPRSSRNPNVVQTYEVGEVGSRHYIVMEYLDGANFARLRQRAAKRGGIPIRISLAVLAQVLEGLDYAHGARGIDGKLLKVVHRDLTPSNVIITAQGVAKILDFGIEAKGADTHSFTQTGRYSGKLNYMPPEQVRGERVDGFCADIFSVGVILAEAALGERFWGTATGPMVASRLGKGELPTFEGARRLRARAAADLRARADAEPRRSLSDRGGVSGRSHPLHQHARRARRSRRARAVRLRGRRRRSLAPAERDRHAAAATQPAFVRPVRATGSAAVRADAESRQRSDRRGRDLDRRGRAADDAGTRCHPGGDRTDAGASGAEAPDADADADVAVAAAPDAAGDDAARAASVAVRPDRDRRRRRAARRHRDRDDRAAARRGTGGATGAGACSESITDARTRAAGRLPRACASK